MQENRFLQLIEAFQARVRLAIGLFEAHRNITDLLNWRHLKLPRRGFITQDKRFEYVFHGIGCRVETSEGEIDWDFGENGRSDGFDLWRLQQFVESSPGSYPEFENETVLSQAFEQAILGGRIKKDPSEVAGHLYYISADTATG